MRRLCPHASLGLVLLLQIGPACEDERRVPSGGEPGPSKNNRAPTATIVAPEEGARVNTPDRVRLAGMAVDPEDGDVPGERLSWVSDIDGELGTGTELFARLSLGAHLITLLAKDTQNAMSAAQVHIRVLTSENQLPAAMITAPSDGAVFTEGDTVKLTGRATDLEDGELAGTGLLWSSSQAGGLGNGSNIAFASPALGEHTIVLTAIDSVGAVGVASIRIRIAARGSNQPPSVRVLRPATGATFTVGDRVEFEGMAADVEDGALGDASVQWWSSADGALGHALVLARNDLSLGIHTITLTATDSAGANASDRIVIAVNGAGNRAPSATIVRPAGGTAFFANQVVTLEGRATDPEDGMLADAQLAWSSSADGALGTGQLFATSSLSVGTHDITLVATDALGARGLAQTSVSVLPANAPPSVSISAPMAGASFSAGALVELVGAATDAEDGALSGSSLVWQSNVDGRLGSGSPLRTSGLTVGRHRIALTAVDSGGLAGTAAVDITIDPAQVNLPPVAQLSGPAMGPTGTALAFDGSASRDSDGAIVDYAFDFGDRTPAVSGPSSTAMHTYAAAGMFTVTLTVRDDDGATADTQHSLTVFVPARVPEIIADLGDDLGGRCDIALDRADRPHVLFLNTDHHQLWYARFDGSAWQTSVVDGPGFDIGGLAARGLALALDAQDRPHVAYLLDTSVRYATPSANGWLRETVSSVYPAAVDRPLAIAFDPANGARPTIAWSHSRPMPVVAQRGAGGGWSELNYAAANSYDHFLGGFAFDSAGTAWLSRNHDDLGIVKWSAARGFFDAETVQTNASPRSYTPLVLDATQSPILVTGSRTLHRVGATWISTSHHSSAASNVDAAMNAAGTLFLALYEGGELEIARPTPFWQYAYQGPMSDTPFGLAVDSAGEPRACFFRSGNLMVY